MNTANPLRIVRILSIVDTREFQEISDGVFVAIPGSGIERECSRCGRTHEIHATVELADKTVAVVGTGCARGESMAVQGGLKTGARNATATAAKEAKLLKREMQLAATVAELANLAPGALNVDTIEFPAGLTITVEEPTLGSRLHTVRLGDFSAHYRVDSRVGTRNDSGDDDRTNWYTRILEKDIAEARRSVANSYRHAEAQKLEAAGVVTTIRTGALIRRRDTLTEEINKLRKSKLGK